VPAAAHYSLPNERPCHADGPPNRLRRREPEGYRIHGRPLDAETGKPVSRETIYVHAFHDPTDHWVTLDPAGADGLAKSASEP